MLIKYVILGLLPALFIACGSSESEPAAQELVSPTPAPTPTPFVAPTSVVVTDLPPESAQLYGLESLKDFPPELMTDASPLPFDEAVAAWDSFIAGTRALSGLGTLVEFCSDHSGQWLLDDIGDLDGLAFVWKVDRGPGDRWNTPRLNITFTGIASDAVRMLFGGDTMVVGLRPPEGDEYRWTGFGSQPYVESPYKVFAGFDCN